MSAIGAVTGQGVYSELEYQGHRFRLGQWTNAAMDAVSTTAFLKAARMTSIMGGNEKEKAQREVALARSFALGAFGFDAIISDGGLDNEEELLATFLWQLLSSQDSTITFALAQEIVRDNREKVIEAINKANPRNGQRMDQPGPTAQESPANAPPSESPGKTIAT